MPRPVRIRITYTGDRSRLTRLEEAVSKDARLLPDLRSKAIGALRELCSLLMEMDVHLGGGQNPLVAAESRPRRRRVIAA